MGIRGVTARAFTNPNPTAPQTQAPRTQNADAAKPGKNRQANSGRGTAPTAQANPEPDSRVQRTAGRIEIVLNERAGTRLRIDATTKQVVAQIVGRHNNVIKQIPPEEALKIAARIRELHGQLFDEII